jgi:hypothetical protein
MHGHDHRRLQLFESTRSWGFAGTFFRVQTIMFSLLCFTYDSETFNDIIAVGIMVMLSALDATT